MLITAVPFFTLPDLFVVLFLLCGMAGSVVLRKLTIPAAVTGGVCGFVIYSGTGYKGLGMLVTFFVLGTIATAWRKDEKRGLVAGDVNPSRRKAGQVMANAGVAGILALLAVFDGLHADLYLLMVAASFASATADTLSSELGMVYGRNFYNIITWKRERKGLDGVVSLEGTLTGIAGAAVIGLLYVWPVIANRELLFVIIAGAIGNLADSVLGAVWERKQYINNDIVNFLNTLIAALIALLLWFYC
ncbi:MAG: DUF92 domain-containing protein [Chitinophagaceae bacterium]